MVISEECSRLTCIDTLVSLSGRELSGLLYYDQALNDSWNNFADEAPPLWTTDLNKLVGVGRISRLWDRGQPRNLSHNSA